MIYKRVQRIDPTTFQNFVHILRVRGVEAALRPVALYQRVEINFAVPKLNS